MRAMAKVAVITGSTGALGQVVARTLLQAGWRVAACDSAARQAALETLEREHPGSAIGVALDITDPAAWTAALPRIAALGDVDGAVLIAGGWKGGTPFHDSDDATWRAMLDSNLETARRTLSALLPRMVERRHGSVVLVGSRAAVRPWESAGAAAYGASKAALVALTQAIAAELVSDGVRLNLVLPSTIDTPANRAAMPSADATRWVAPESLADVISFLLSDAARDVSGAALPVYGRA